MGGLLTRIGSAYYLKKIHEDSKVLHYKRSPTWRSLVLFTVLFALTHYISIQAEIWYLGIICYALGVYFTYITTEKYEEVIFDKTKGTVSLMNSRFLEKHLLGYRRKIHSANVVTELSEIIAVSVEGQEPSLGGGGHNVILLFISGLTLSLTAQCTFGDKKEHEKIAQEIENFLNLRSKTSQEENSESEEDDREMDKNDSTDKKNK